MESLTSSCSKPFFYGLASSSSPRLVSAFHFSDRLKFSFSNNKIGNFRFLHMFQNKNISPVHAVRAQVDFETEKPRAQETEGKLVRIKFQLQKECRFGEQFLIVGDHPIIGAWDPSNALPMTWSEGHQWFGVRDVPAEISIKFKFILKSVSGDIIWQPGPDRIVNTRETANGIIVRGYWENAWIQETREDKSNGKPVINSGMSNSSENLNRSETWSEGHLSSVVTDVPADKSIKYKFILKSLSGDILWQPWPDQIVKTNQKTGEDKSNGKPVIDSGMSNSSENPDRSKEETVSKDDTVTSLGMSNSSANSNHSEDDKVSEVPDARDGEDNETHSDEEA